MRVLCVPVFRDYIGMENNNNNVKFQLRESIIPMNRTEVKYYKKRVIRSNQF